MLDRPSFCCFFAVGKDCCGVELSRMFGDVIANIVRARLFFLGHNISLCRCEWESIIADLLIEIRQCCVFLIVSPASKPGFCCSRLIVCYVTSAVVDGVRQIKPEALGIGVKAIFEIFVVLDGHIQDGIDVLRNISDDHNARSILGKL